MKRILSTLTFAIAFIAASVSASEWTEDAAAAINESKTEDKVLLMNFTGSDWCHWCKKIEGEIFSDKMFKDYADENLVLLKLDFPSKIPQSAELKEQNKKLLDKHGVRGFPTILALNSEGEVIGKLGYTHGGAAEFLSQLKAL
ncbi:thioredoxin family protein [Puniceicoccaceae bacterium K14]|nr:thioredoxin family protein [Puniceicoccaceae bacterium K14]